MKDFTMTARTVDGDLHTFRMTDVPCFIDENHLALLLKPGSPILESDNIRRGFDGFVEGDILEDPNGHRWLVCYERGFYIIDNNYRIMYLDKCKEWKRLGDCYEIEFPIKCSFRQKHLFKSCDHLYHMNYIYGVHGRNVLIRGLHTLTVPENIHQECCMTYNGSRLFLGDIVEGHKVILHNGRVCIELTEGNYKDLATGGIIC